MSSKFPHVFLDISVGAQALGRIVFELFTDLTPRTAENFRGLCTGEYGKIGLRATTKKLSYEDSKFHRINPEFFIQGGDITNGDGSGGHSIYGSPYFDDESFQRRHSCGGLLSTVSKGRNTNNSQFMITLNPCPHLDGKQVVFGQVIYGMDVIRKMAKTPIDLNGKPRLVVSITECGQVNDPKAFIKLDPFSAEKLQELRDLNRRQQQPTDGEIDQAIKDEEEAHQDALALVAGAEKEFQELMMNPKLKLLPSERHLVQTAEGLGKRKPLEDEKAAKLQALREKIEKAKRQNLDAAIKEEEANTSEDYTKRVRGEKRRDFMQHKTEELEFKGIKDKEYLNKPALAQAAPEKQKTQVFGWDVFNEDSLYRANKKRSDALPFYKDEYERQMENPDVALTARDEADRAERMAEDLKTQIEKRKDYSRRRTFNPEEKVTYVNERNRVYNMKLERHFSQHSLQIKANLERGTALNN